MSYLQFNPPERYSIVKVFYSCNSCSLSFFVLEPNGDDIVKYIAPEGKEERWLPTYGKGGYFYLMERLLPDFTEDQEITMEISRRFEKAFSSIQKLSTMGKPFVLCTGTRCLGCGSKDLHILEVSPLDTPPLDWVEYNLEV